MLKKPKSRKSNKKSKKCRVSGKKCRVSGGGIGRAPFGKTVKGKIFKQAIDMMKFKSLGQKVANFVDQCLASSMISYLRKVDNDDVKYIVRTYQSVLNSGKLKENDKKKLLDIMEKMKNSKPDLVKKILENPEGEINKITVQTGGSLSLCKQSGGFVSVVVVISVVVIGVIFAISYGVKSGFFSELSNPSFKSETCTQKRFHMAGIGMAGYY